MKGLSISGKTGMTVLILSLALNIFLLTAIGIRALQGDSYHHWSSIEAIEERFARRLSKDDAKSLQRAFAAHRRELASRIEEYQKARAGLRQSMAEEPLNRLALEKAFADNRAAMTALQGAIQAVMLEAATGISADGRRRLFAKSGH